MPNYTATRFEVKGGHADQSFSGGISNDTPLGNYTPLSICSGVNLESWTPLMAYETSLTACIYATQHFLTVQAEKRKCCAITLSTCGKKVEAYERLMTKAYSLLAAEAVQTSNVRMGTILTNAAPPSYEQAADSKSPAAPDTFTGPRFLKDQEQQWRSCWENLADEHKTPQAERVTLQNLVERIPHCTMADLDHQMTQVEQYLLDAESGARKYLEDIDREKQDEEGEPKSRRVSSKHEHLPRDQATEDREIGLKLEEHAAQPKKIRSGLIRWLLRIFSTTAVRAERKEQRQSAVSSGSRQALCRTNRNGSTISISTLDTIEEEPVPFQRFQVVAVYDQGRTCSPHFRVGDLSFLAGQIIEVVGVRDRNWYVGEYTDTSGATCSGRVPRFFTVMYHPKIFAILKNGINTTDSTKAVKPNFRHPGTPKDDILQEQESLKNWLELEKEDWALAMRSLARDIARKRQPRVPSAAALIERMDALEIWLRRHRSEGLVLEGMIASMKCLRTEAKGQLLEEQSREYQEMLNGFTLY